MKAENYITILNENLKVSAVDLGLGRWFSFKQDNDPKHKIKSVISWLKNNKITVLFLAGLSGAQSKIQSKICIKLKIRIGCRQPKKTLQQLEEVCMEEWNNIPTEVCANLVVNYRKRFLSVIKNKGHAIDY